MKKVALKKCIKAVNFRKVTAGMAAVSLVVSLAACGTNASTKEAGQSAAAATSTAAGQRVPHKKQILSESTMRRLQYALSEAWIQM